MHNRVSNKNQLLFNGYKRLKKPVTGGKQKKDNKSGFYQDGENTYYIKRSRRHPEDDLAEVLAAKIGNILAPGRFAACDFIKAQDQTGLLYVKSLCAPECQELLPPSGITSMYSKNEKDKVFSELQKQEGHTQQMAQILASCLLMREYDCHPGNIVITKYGVIKIDHGWAFDGILNHADSSITDLTRSAKRRFLKRKPTNHFNDYPKIIRNKAKFAEAIKTVLDNFNQSSIEKCISEVLESTDNPVTEKTKMAFMKRINGGKIPDFATHDITQRLKKALADRHESMKSLYSQLTGQNVELTQRLRNAGYNCLPDLRHLNI